MTKRDGHGMRPKRWRQAGGFNPFWTPWANDEQPKQIECIVRGTRQLPAKGKMPAQPAIDVETFDGELLTVAVSASIRLALGGEDYKAPAAGTFLRFTYKGERKVGKRGVPMRDVQTDVPADEDG